MSRECERPEALRSLTLPARQAPATKPLFDTAHILTFARGNPSAAFGDRYRPFDRDRVMARLPRPPYSFVHRILSVENCEQWKLAAGGTVTAEYDVPPDAWYFAAERAPRMPYSVLLEVALQPCGWLAAYLGAALTSPVDLAFRNLGGTATQFADVRPDAGTLSTTATMMRASHSAGMIILHYDFSVLQRAQVVFKGDTYFGFFTREALANQVGVREVTPYQPSADEEARGERLNYPEESPFPDKQLRMIDAIELFVPDGGPHGRGFIRGTKAVDPGEWFFDAHFYQDPVWPGSLGLESFLQLLKVVAHRRWGDPPADGWQAVAPGQKHEWVYRGQVVPGSRLVTVQAELTEADDAARWLRADGLLLVDGMVIYQMKGFTLKV